MASKYLQKYPVPAGFEQVLHDFAREVLRDQPDNIIEYAASYFEMLEQGKKFEYESKFNVKKSQKKTNLQYNSKTAAQLAQKAGNAVNLINQNAQKQEEKRKVQSDSKKSLDKKSNEIAIGTQIQPEYAAPRPDSQHSKHSKHSNAQQPSIQNFSQPEQRPASGVSKKSKSSNVNVLHEPSSTTLMKEQGKKFIHQINKGAANTANIQQIKEETPSQLQSQLASKYVQEESNSVLNKLQEQNELTPLSVQLIEVSQRVILGQGQEKKETSSPPQTQQLVQQTKEQVQNKEEIQLIQTIDGDNNIFGTITNQQFEVQKQQDTKLSSPKIQEQKLESSNVIQESADVLIDKKSETQEPQQQLEQAENNLIKSKPQSAKSNQSAPKNE